MSAIFRSSFLFNGLRNTTRVNFKRFFPTQRFIPQAIGYHSPIDLSFGLVTPLPTIKTDSVVKEFFSTIEQALEGGVSYLQLWGPNETLQASLPIVLDLKKIASKRNIPLIVNNCADIALKAGLAGVHLGQKDLPYRDARQLLGQSSVIGLTVNTWEDVLAAQNLDVTYIGVQIFPSRYTKPPKSTDVPTWGLEGAEKIIAFTRHRVVLIGNITLTTLPTVKKVLRPGVGIAIAGEIMRAANPYSTTRAVCSLILQKLHNKTEGSK